MCKADYVEFEFDFFFYRNSGWSGLRYECGLAFPVVSLEIGDFLSLTL